MIEQKLKLKRIFILGDSSIIFNALTDNLPKYFPYLENSNELSINKQNHHFEIKVGNKSLLIEQISEQNLFKSTIIKADIIFIDQSNYINLIQPFRINILANLTNNIILNNEIVFVKPCLLHDLIHLIMRNFHDQSIFCCINDEWIYHESSSCLKSIDQIIALTDKENILFKTLLSMDQFKCEKDYLRFNVWNYHQDSESSTVETHLYKLKNKLPDGLLEFKNSYCQLNIDTIE